MTIKAPQVNGVAPVHVEHGKTPPNWVPAGGKPLFSPRKLKVVCVGAGFAGLMIAYRWKHEFNMSEYIDLTIYEKNADIGGTWLGNRYPGVACDVPAHIYTFPFEPNPDWSQFYVSGPEIWQYMKRTTEKYKLDDRVELNSKIISSIWDDEAGKWRIKIQKTDSVGSANEIEVEADVLINGSGFLSKWSWPKIKGIETYQGTLVHSAAWDTSLDWTDKRVAIIGNGSSAIQILPQMQLRAKSITTYIRSPTWISANFAAEFTPNGKNFIYAEEQKKKFREDSDELYNLRRSIEDAMNKLFYTLVKDSPEQKAVYALFKKTMEQRLNHDPVLCAKLIPDYEVGCRRLSPGDDYLEALQRDNVSIEFTGIQEITPTGITSQASAQEFDIIVAATGFDVSYCPSWKVVGKGGIQLAEQWKDHPEAYFGTCTPNMPNFFIINGPNSPVAHGSLLGVMDWTAAYILRWCRKIASQDIKSVTVSTAATDDYNVYTQEALKRTVWTGNCRSWFKNGSVDGRVTAMYAGSVMHFKEVLEEFRTEDFEFAWRNRNRFSFMGNGITIREEKKGDLAYYVRR